MFTQTPNNLSSLYSELIYTFQSSSTTDMTIQIYEDETDELIGVKKFYSTDTAQINVAPHIRPYAMPTIDIYSMGFITPYRNCNVSVYLKMYEQNSTSTARQFTLSRGDIEAKGLVSSLPQLRTIADGESEQIYVAAESGDQVKVVVQSYLDDWSESYQKPYLDGEFVATLVSSTTYSTTANDGAMEIFNFVASSNKVSEEQIERVVVSVYVDSVLTQSVEYTVVARGDESMRMAWISERGSIEHYTFPIIKESGVDGDSGASVTLTSAFETYDTRCALSNIARSPMVWLLRNGEYELVEPMNSSLSVAPTATLGTIDIKVSCND